MANLHDGDMHVTGALSAERFSPAAWIVDNAAIAAGAGVEAAKLQHQYKPTFALDGSPVGVAAKVLHVVRGATGTVERFRAGSIAPNVGDYTVTVDLKKNGVSILQSILTLDSGHSAYQAVEAVLASTALVADDVLSVTISANGSGAGAFGTGFFFAVEIREDAD